MDSFSKIEYLPVQETPKKLRRKTLNKIIVLKMRPLIYVISLVAILNLFFLSSHIYKHLAETEALTIIRIMAQDFEFSFDYIANSLAGLKEIMPLVRLSFWTINVLMVAGLGIFFKRYQTELLKA